MTDTTVKSKSLIIMANDEFDDSVTQDFKTLPEDPGIFAVNNSINWIVPVDLSEVNTDFGSSNIFSVKIEGYDSSDNQTMRASALIRRTSGILYIYLQCLIYGGSWTAGLHTAVPELSYLHFQYNHDVGVTENLDAIRMHISDSPTGEVKGSMEEEQVRSCTREPAYYKIFMARMATKQGKLTCYPIHVRTDRNRSADANAFLPDIAYPHEDGIAEFEQPDDITVEPGFYMEITSMPELVPDQEDYTGLAFTTPSTDLTIDLTGLSGESTPPTLKMLGGPQDVGFKAELPRGFRWLSAIVFPLGTMVFTGFQSILGILKGIGELITNILVDFFKDTWSFIMEMTFLGIKAWLDTSANKKNFAQWLGEAIADPDFLVPVLDGIFKDTTTDFLSYNQTTKVWSIPDYTTTNLDNVLNAPKYRVLKRKQSDTFWDGTPRTLGGTY